MATGPEVRAVTAGMFAGAVVVVHFVNRSGFLDCRFAADFGPHRRGEVVVLRPSDVETQTQGG